MAVTQNELITALQTLLSTTDVRLLMRTGTAAQLDLSSLVAGEFAVATDTQEVYCCFGNGIFRNLARGIVIKGVYATLGALQTAHPTGTEGDIYAAGSAPQHLYVWTNSTWTDMGAWNDTTLFATDSAVVHKTGNETIAGVKTFSSDPVLPNPAWTTATLLGTWTGHIYYKKVSGRVYIVLDALLNASAVGTQAFTMPVGYRPGKAYIDNFLGQTTSAPCRSVITTTGDIYIQSPTGGYNTTNESYNQYLEYLAEG